MTRGGKRNGAGRPSQGKVKISITIDADVLAKLPSAGRSEAINKILKSALNG